MPSSRAYWALGYLGGDYIPLSVIVAKTFMHCALASARPLTYTRWTDHQTLRIAACVKAGRREALQKSLDKWYPLAKAIISSAVVRALWEDITPLARNEWICWVTSGAKAETRVIRIEKALSKMKGGMRRPCCWAGCPHR